MLEPPQSADTLDRIGTLLSDALVLADAADEDVLGIKIEDARGWAIGRRQALAGGRSSGSDDDAGRRHTSA